MSRGPSQRLEDVFATVLDCPPDERSAALDQMCADDAELRREIDELLAAHDDAGRYFDDLSGDIVAAASLELESAVQADVQIGPYRTKKIIGRGGMGVVFLASRVDGEFDQQVALKLLHLDMDTPEASARFRTERQILARLKHPNIANLLDGGVTDEGRPYFVMEYIEGQPITLYCEDQALQLEERLRLFLDIVGAVSYLQRNLIVHRDLKPGNILVDHDGQVKLLDFGIAKLLTDEGDMAARTRTGLQLMTPEYAAPEQLAGGTVTTATDVYALGVLLYELLTGRRPHTRAAQSPAAAAEHEVITAPSAVVRSRRRDPHEEPRGDIESASYRLPWRRIAGDLDNICLMALRPEQERRYPSAAQLGQDVERHLSGLPVSARGSSVGYRVRKFCQRHKLGVAVAAVVLVLTLVGFLRERGLRAEAESEAAKAVAVLDFLQDLLSSADPKEAQGREITVAEVLDGAAAKLEGGEAFRDQPSVEAAVRRAIGDTYRSLIKLDEAEEHLQRALELQRQSVGDRHPETLGVLSSLGFLYYAQRRLDEAEALFRQVLELRSELLGEDHPDTLAVMNHLATVLWNLEKYGEMVDLDRRTLAARRRILGDDHPDTLRSLNNLATTLFQNGSYGEAAEVFQQVLVAQRQQLGSNHPDVLMLMNNLGSTYLELGRHREAEELLQETVQARTRVLGEKDYNTVMSMHNLAVGYIAQARYEEAEVLLDRVIVLRERHPGLYYSMSHLADVYREQERLDEAEELYLSTLERQRRDNGPEHVDTLRTTIGLAELYLRRGNPSGAEGLVVSAREALHESLGETHALTLQATITLVRVRLAQHRFAEALELSEQVVAAATRSFGAAHPIVREATRERQRALLGSGSGDVARSSVR